MCRNWPFLCRCSTFALTSSSKRTVTLSLDLVDASFSPRQRAGDSCTVPKVARLQVRFANGPGSPVYAGSKGWRATSRVVPAASREQLVVRRRLSETMLTVAGQLPG